MNELHVGRGTTRGVMTVFPVWVSGTEGRRCLTDASRLEVSEREEGPAVSDLLVANHGDQPVLVLEGQLFEGGWQHRMATRSVLVGAGQRVPVQVACVEQGRWGGDRRQSSRGRRATPYVRDAVRAGGRNDEVRGEVWRRVEHEIAGTVNLTRSLVQRMDLRPRTEETFEALPGQAGVLIGVGGQPLLLEVFDSVETLREQLPALVESVSLDAESAPQVATPSRRALRFVRELEQLWLRSADEAGLAQELRGASAVVDASVVRWDEHDLHLRATHVAHPLLAGAAL